MSHVPFRVVKIGGSLLTFDLAPQRILQWLESQTPMPTVWIVGGGKLVDCVREWDKIHSIDQETAHWMSIDLMDFNGSLVYAWFPDWKVTCDLDQLETNENANAVFKPSTWLQENSSLLPKSWRVTSDSIAAEIANAIAADELVLMKSIDAPPHATIDSLVESETVDSHFPQAYKSNLLRIVNLNSMNECVVE